MSSAGEIGKHRFFDAFPMSFITVGVILPVSLHGVSQDVTAVDFADADLYHLDIQEKHSSSVCQTEARRLADTYYYSPNEDVCKAYFAVSVENAASEKVTKSSWLVPVLSLSSRTALPRVGCPREGCSSLSDYQSEVITYEDFLIQNQPPYRSSKEDDNHENQKENGSN